MNEYDVIILKNKISDIPPGTQGTILIIHKENGIEKAYEVEFIDKNGTFLGVFTVPSEI